MAFKVLKDKDNGFEAFFKSVKSVDKLRARVGVQGTDALKSRGDGLTAVKLAEIHEFGAPRANVPQRSFLRSTADQNKTRYQRVMAKALRKLVKNPKTFNAKAELFQLGERVRGDIIKRIRGADIKQDLAPSTRKAKARKGGTAEPALIDTGQLIASITSVVE